MACTAVRAVFVGTVIAVHAVIAAFIAAFIANTPRPAVSTDSAFKADTHTIAAIVAAIGTNFSVILPAVRAGVSRAAG